MSSNQAELPALVTHSLVVVSVIFPILSAVALYFRYRARCVSHATLGSDHWWLVITWIATLGMSITVWVFAALGGIDKYKVELSQGIIYSNKCLWVASFFNQASLSAVKIAILLFYKRIFSTHGFHIAAWISIALVSAWGILFFFLILFYGDPISKSWDASVGHWRYDPVPVGLANVGTSIGLDIVVLSLPLPMIYKLHLPTKKKIALGLIFWLGSFCCIAAIVRVILLHQVLQGVADAATNIGTQSVQFVFVIVEPHASIIAACLPCFGPLLKGMRGPESLIRSVRSALSLGSRGSAESHATTPYTTKFSTQAGSGTASNIKLHEYNSLGDHA
ncbi:hypothetical protein GGR51DRAFT_391100 [Nemania sp. FL0031]|nr:hypothetical protein GGR51DRAFT_391100 [Nemania sp. FL0031]